MNKKTMIIVGVAAVLIIIAVIIFFVKERFNASQKIILKFEFTPMITKTSSQLNHAQLSAFISSLVPNYTILITDVPQTNVQSPYLAQIVCYTTDNKVLSIIPIASTEWYKTQNLSIAQLNDAIYQNPRVVEELKKIAQ